MSLLLFIIHYNNFYLVSQTKLEQRNKKIKVDHQGHISVTLEKMDKCGFGTHILNLTDCPPSIDWQVHSDYLNPAQGLFFFNFCIRSTALSSCFISEYFDNNFAASLALHD